MTPTATIRVPETVRDRFAELAAAQGISLSKYLEQLASREHLHFIYAAEREAMKADLANPEFLAELDLWDSIFDEFD